MRWLDKKGIKCALLTFIFSLTIYFLIPILISKSKFFTHITIHYYLCQLQNIILYLPLAIALYSILPIRKYLDYRNYLSKIPDSLFIGIIFFISLVVTNLISYYLYDHIPQGDACVTFYQAKIFASGRRWTNPPVYPEFFSEEMVINNGKWFSKMPPGHSLILSLGIPLRIPWLICPLLGSFSLIVFFLLLKHLFSPIIAKIGTLLLLFSPTFLFISASMLSQNSSYFFLLIAIFLMIKAIKSRTYIYPILSGLSTGIAFISRPQLALVFGIALAIIGKNKRILTLFILGLLPLVVYQLLDNYFLTGNPLYYGYHIYPIPKCHTMGFGLGKGVPTFGIPGHTPLKAIINLIYNVFVFSLHLFGWPLLSLIFVPVIFFKRLTTFWDKLALGLIIGAILFWSFYWFHGVSPMGAKYYYEITPFLVLLTVRGIESLKINLRPLVSLLVFVNIFVYIPRATKIFTLWGTNLNCYTEVKKKNIHNAIVFIKDLPYDRKSREIWATNRFNYPSVEFRNAPNIGESDIIYAKDLGKEANMRLQALYPTRKVYLFEYLSPQKWQLIELK